MEARDLLPKWLLCLRSSANLRQSKHITQWSKTPGGGALEGEGVAEGEGGEEGGQEGGEEERVKGGGEGGELGADELPPAEKGAGGQGGEEERRRKRESMRLMESNSISRNATKGDSGDVGGSCIAKRVDGRGMHCRLSQ
ncbi:hypothetical protein CRG98_018221 [Punica granatum]|uniref:Uncharacterized protein n=1 Tax=Punica granatum TaxID=22663 RepID=A0A2I0JZW8_PUNGR|nr:hypothetical protein CRG98_018221 [Punica granatum]